MSSRFTSCNPAISSFVMVGFSSIVKLLSESIISLAEVVTEVILSCKSSRRAGGGCTYKESDLF